VTIQNREMSKLDWVGPLSFRYAIDPAEHARAVVAASRTSRWRFLAFGFMVTPFLPIIMFGLTDDKRWIHPRIVVPLLIVVGLSYLLFGPWAQRIRIRHALRKSPTLRAEHIYEFSDYGLRTQSGATSTSVTWKDIRRVEESAEFFFFFTSARHAHYLPKRLMVDEVQANQLHALIRANALGARLARRVGSDAPVT
jgi:hypothetical protein